MILGNLQTEYKEIYYVNELFFLPFGLFPLICVTLSLYYYISLSLSSAYVWYQLS